MNILRTECSGLSAYVITLDSLHLIISVSEDKYKFSEIGTEFLCLIWTKCVLRVVMLTHIQRNIMLLPLWIQLETPLQEQ
jgi:hypothetical protein